MEFVKGPDFPTRGMIMGRAGIRQAYATGQGDIRVRGKILVQNMPQRQDFWLRLVIHQGQHIDGKARGG